MGFKVGMQLHPQHTTTDELIEAARHADRMGVDSIWVWDHMFPLYGDEDDVSFECYTLLAAIAQATEHAMLGALVAGNTYRNPELLAYMTNTIDHISHGRAILGVGAGWCQRDYDEYGYEFGDAPSRLRELGKALPRIKSRIARMDPQPVGSIPIMIGGGGEKVTLRLTAQYADMWNGGAPAETWARKNGILNQWCEKVGRDPGEIERTVMIGAQDLDQLPGLLEAGVTHVILQWPTPYDVDPLEGLLKQARN